jgi:hypothetical protein
MLLYADEDFPYPVVEDLRRLGHDVLTTQEDGRTATPDAGILARAHELDRAVLTCNRRHYERLHRHGADHSGIISATRDPGKNVPLARRIDAALTGRTPGTWTIRVNRPQKP